MALQRNKSGPSRLLSFSNHGRFEYDVFLSFCGEDTRNNFTGFFQYILKQQGIHAFFDEKGLPKGKGIEEIFEAITKSKILVPIFSQRYAESTWCLREVAKMVECVDGGQERLIIPIFFDVDPTDVRHQTGPFEAAFKEHLQNEKRDEVDGWRRALQYIGGISGYHLKGQYNGKQLEIVVSIVDQIQKVVTTRIEYDVFLSFHGNDTRNNFTSFFHYLLEQKEISTFFDEKDLRKGAKIEEIFEAIRKSKILVPIFSQRYAESKWCLREAAKMVECVDGGQERLIIPIFFDVHPTNVRHQTGPFKAAFKEYLQNEKRDEVDGWRRALHYIGGISGYHLKDYYNGNQPKLVDSIIDEIQTVLATNRLLHEEEYLVGVDVRAEEFINCLDFEAKDALIIGIHGIGGIGKTTLAKAIYNRSRHRFQASCFIENVREVSKLSGLVHLQQRLIQDISMGKHKKEIHNSSQGAKMIEDMVRGKRVLLVLDDVDDQKQLDALAGNIRWFHSGSRVIVTTRQKNILEGLQNESFYLLEQLEEEEALELFKHHAFGADGPQEEYNDLIEEVVSISNGLPLNLQVFGALFKTARTPEEWKKLLKELRRRQHSEIREKIRIIYDSLNDEEKLIFLDIACLLVGQNSEEAIYVWEDLKLSPRQTLRSLQEKSLVKINKGKFEMHDRIRDMGREVVLRESPRHPENRSRLWNTRDIMEASIKSQSSITEGIILNVHEGSETNLSTRAFEYLFKLRILHINFAIFGGSDFRHFPASLKWLEWKGCPLETLPLESKFKSIVVLNLSGSSISKLWSETTTGTSSKSVKELFIGLKLLDLSSCHCLIATPNFTLAPNLEKLILDQCRSLKEVDDSIGYLKKLVFLSMRECVSLEKLPNKIYELSSLQVFNLEGCQGLVAFPQIPEDLTSVEKLDPGGTSTSRILYINQTPHIDVTNSTIDLSNQKRLILRDCGSLKFLPCHRHMFPSLRCLHIDGCLQDMAFRVWDIEAVYISGSPTLPRKQEFSFVLPVGLISDPLLLQQLRCHGCGDPSLNGTMVLTVHRKDLTNERWIALGTYEFRSEDSNSKDDVYGQSYTINFGSNDKINEVPRGKTTIMKVTTSNDCKLTKVDVKLQNRSKFSGENMKPFISISRREASSSRVPPPSLPPSSSRRSELQVSIFLNHYEEVKLDVIKYSTGIGNCIDQIKNQLNVQCDELTLLFGWTIKELIIAFTLFLSDINVSYELGRGTGLRPPAGLEVYVKIKILDLSYCRFLVKTHDFAWSPNLEKLVLDHCEHLLEIDESIGRLKTLIRLSVVGCTKLGALPYGILQLKSLKVLNIGKCPNIKMLPEASMKDVSLDALEVFILDECTSLTGIPDYVGGFKCLRHLSLRSCHLLKQLSVSNGRWEALETLILDGCTSLTEFLDYVAKVGSLRSLSLTEMPNHIGRLKSLRSLSLRGCPSVKQLPDAIGSLVLLEELLFDCFPSLERLPDSIGNLMSLTKMRCIRCPSLTSMPDLSGLMALEELIVAGCSSIVIIPGLEKLISLKVLHMCGCRCLDLGWIRLQLQIAEFHDLEAFSISFSTGNHSLGIPFPIGRRTSSKPLLVEKIDVLERTNIVGQPSHIRYEIKVAVREGKAKFGNGQVLPSRPVKDGVPYYVDAYLSRVDSLSHWERPLWLQGHDDPPSLYSAGIGEDDEINERLRLLTATSSDHGSRVGTLNVSCSEGNFCAEAFDVHMVSPNCRRRRQGLIEHWIGG